MIKLAAETYYDTSRRQTGSFHSEGGHVECVWWNFKGIINHFELVQNGVVNAAALYSGQLDDRICTAALAARRYPAALINRKHMLLQHDKDPLAPTFMKYHFMVY